MHKKEFEKKLPQDNEKVCDKNERKKVLETKKKYGAHKNVSDGRSEFIGCLWKSSMIDCKEPQVDTMKVLFVL